MQRCKTVVFLILSIFFFQFQAKANEAETIIQSLINSRNQSYEEVSVQMNLFDGSGAPRDEKRIFTISSFSPNKDILKSLIAFKEPPSIKNAKVLTVINKGDSGQWIYLPSTRKVSRIHSANEDEGVFDSDLSYSDLKGETFEDYNYSMGEPKLVEYAAKQCGEPAHAVVSTSKSRTNVQYAKRLLSVSKSKMIICDIITYSKTNTILKRVQNLEFKEYSGKWRPSKSIVTSFTKAQKPTSKTELLFYNWTIKKSFDEKIFSPELLDK